MKTSLSGQNRTESKSLTRNIQTISAVVTRFIFASHLFELFAVFANIIVGTITFVESQIINTRAIILTRLRQAFVDVLIAPTRRRNRKLVLVC